jgi:hypothetical protein
LRGKSIGELKTQKLQSGKWRFFAGEWNFVFLSNRIFSAKHIKLPVDYKNNA